MAYSTPALVRLVLSSVDVEQGGTAAELSDPQIQFEIEAVSADIDARLRNRYLIPFPNITSTNPTIPTIIKQICTDMAAYRADLNYRKSREYDNDRMPIILRNRDAERLLESLRRGRSTVDWPRASTSEHGALVVNPGEGPLLTYYGSVQEQWPRW